MEVSSEAGVLVTEAAKSTNDINSSSKARSLALLAILFLIKLSCRIEYLKRSPLLGAIPKAPIAARAIPFALVPSELVTSPTSALTAAGLSVKLIGERTAVSPVFAIQWTAWN